MEISLPHTSFITQPAGNRVQSTHSNQLTKELPRVIRTGSVSDKTVDPNDDKPFSSREYNQLFTLRPEQSRQTFGLQANIAGRSGYNHSSISQYLQTENIPLRNELESLLRLDIFV